MILIEKLVKETNLWMFLIGEFVGDCENYQLSRNSPAVSVRASQPPVPPSKLSQRNQTTNSLPVNVTPKTEKRLIEFKRYLLYVTTSWVLCLFIHDLEIVCHCRVLPDIGHLNAKDSKDQHEASALRDEVCQFCCFLFFSYVFDILWMGTDRCFTSQLDMLQEENESILEKV